MISQQKEVYISETYSEMLKEKNILSNKYKKYINNIQEEMDELRVFYKKALIQLDLNNSQKTKEYLNQYVSCVMKLVKLHKDIKEEVIYSRYYLLLAKVENKQKATVEKRKLLKKINKALKVHEEEINKIKNKMENI